jgi:hypothetical protein
MLVKLHNEAGDSEYIVQTENITFIHADGAGSRIHFVGGSSIKINATIKLIKYMFQLDGALSGKETSQSFDKR